MGAKSFISSPEPLSVISEDNGIGRDLAFDEKSKQIIQKELECLLSSPAFRSSSRCQDFLRFTVAHAVKKPKEAPKERMIGIEVFGRPPDYDTGQDAIVRVKANEVRRRLAQYYMEAGTGGEVRFELLPGSYLLTFKW